MNKFVSSDEILVAASNYALATNCDRAVVLVWNSKSPDTFIGVSTMSNSDRMRAIGELLSDTIGYYLINNPDVIKEIGERLKEGYDD